jgi:hypothetical protein
MTGQGPRVQQWMDGTVWYAVWYGKAGRANQDQRLNG